MTGPPTWQSLALSLNLRGGWWSLFLSFFTMYTKVALKWMIYTIQNVNFWCCAPYAWNKSKQQMEFVPSPARNFLWYSNILAHSLYSGYLFARAIHMNFFDASAQMGAKLFMEYSILVYFLPVLFQTSVLIRTKEMVAFTNGHIKCFQQLERKLLGQFCEI